MVAVIFQLAILFVSYLAIVHAGRDVGRWLAVHPDTTDAALTAYVNGDLPSEISASHLTVLATPGCATLSDEDLPTLFRQLAGTISRGALTQ